MGLAQPLEQHERPTSKDSLRHTVPHMVTDELILALKCKLSYPFYGNLHYIL